MKADSITAGAVRDALRAVRYGTSLADSPLLGLDIVTVRLRSEGRAETEESRQCALAEMLSDRVWQELGRRRSPGESRARSAMTPELELSELASDFSVGNLGREAWGMLHYRFFSEAAAPVRAAEKALGVPARTLRRRVKRGCEALAEQLRIAELELDAAEGLAPPDRILVVEEGRERGSLQAMGDLISTVRDDGGATTRLTLSQAQGIAQYPASELEAFHATRIAEWSQPRYRLDQRFVQMSLLVDLGEESLAGRWQKQEKRFTDLRDVLAEVAEPAVVLVGPPGSGKSTLLRRLELDLAVDGLRASDSRDTPFTFLTSLNMYKPDRPGSQPPAPLQWLSERWRARFPNLSAFEDLLEAGTIILLLDGLNEIPHRDLREYRERVGLWKHFLHASVAETGARAVIACRSLDYSSPLSSRTMRVPQVRLEPLTDDRVVEFLESYAPATAADLWEQLQSTALLEVARWPFILRLVVEQAVETGQLAAGLAELFTTFLRRALVREVQRENPLFGPGPLIDAHDYERLMSRPDWRTAKELPCRSLLFERLAILAYEMQRVSTENEQSQLRVSYQDALGLLDCPHAESVVRAGQEMGVLDEDLAADDVFYVHQLVQEYFAARRLAAAPDPNLCKLEWRADSIDPSLEDVVGELAAADPLPTMPSTRWDETTSMACAMCVDQDRFVCDLMSTNLPLAGKCAAQPDVAISRATIRQLRESLVARSRDSEADLRARIKAALVLGELGDPRFALDSGPEGDYLQPPMADVPGGRYTIGADTELSEVWSPRHEVTLKAFRIGRFPVTVAEWKLFMASGGYDDERWWPTDAAAAWCSGEGTSLAATMKEWNVRREFTEDRSRLKHLYDLGRVPQLAYEQWVEKLKMSDEEFEAHLEERYSGGRLTEPDYWSEPIFAAASKPVVGVSWFEAEAYCHWLTAQTGITFRLPTEVEFEAAARGLEGRLYPWGDECSDGRCNSVEAHVRSTTPVGVFPCGDTPNGISDLSGNTYEWTSTLWGDFTGEPAYGYPYCPDDGREDTGAPATVCRVLRGSSWARTVITCHACFRTPELPDRRGNDGGFRLAASTE